MLQAMIARATAKLGLTGRPPSLQPFLDGTRRPARRSAVQSDRAIGLPARGGRIARLHGAAVLSLAIATAGCVTLPRTAHTGQDQESARLVGFENVRWFAEDPDALGAFEEQLVLRSRTAALQGRQLDVLSISGGGSNGAFGAGVLVGWTGNGRPEFDVVTGVSAGALIAPFAFLGADWDAQLRHALTQNELTAKIVSLDGLMSLFRVGLSSSEPLETLTASYVTDAMVAALATEHARGRRLLVATTNLDAQRSVVWDIGAIATRRDAQARALIIRVLVASSSVPAAYPPVMIEVAGPTQRFWEMHVDGGVIHSFVAIPQTRLLQDGATSGVPRTRLFYLMNSRIDPDFEVTRRSTVSIAARSLLVLQQSNDRTMLDITGAYCSRRGLDCVVMQIPSGVRLASTDFSREHRQTLFDQGLASVRTAGSWRELAGPSPSSPASP